jgi:hypothetical protein
MEDPRPGRDAVLFVIGGLLGLGLVALSSKDVRRVLGSGDYTCRSRWRSR